jgi:hypothetical protein
MFVLFYYTDAHKAIEIKQFEYLSEIEQRLPGLPNNQLLNRIFTKIFLALIYYFCFLPKFLCLNGLVGPISLPYFGEMSLCYLILI